MFKYTKEVNSCLLQLQQGDTTQLGQLFDITANHLRGVAAKNLYNKDNIDDVVSEVYIKVHSYIYSYRRGENGYNWMCKITENTARTMNAKEIRTAIADAKFVRDMEIENECSDSGIENIMFLSQFTQLSAKDKIVAYRWLYLDETLQEIAQNLDVSKVAVHQRIKNISKIMDKLPK